jgi:hypothetical protein
MTITKKILLKLAILHTASRIENVPVFAHAGDYCMLTHTGVFLLIKCYTKFIKR